MSEKLSTSLSLLYKIKRGDVARTKNVTQQLARECAATDTRKSGKRTITRRNGKEKTGRTSVDGLEQLAAKIRS
jgi:hypothetical protein